MSIQVAAATARTIFFNRDRFVWNDWSSTSLTTFTLSKSDMLTVSGFQAASRTKGKRKRFLSYNGFCKVPRSCIELHCLILLDILLDIEILLVAGKNGKKYDPSGRSPTPYAHASSNTLVISVTLVCCEQAHVRTQCPACTPSRQVI